MVYTVTVSKTLEVTNSNYGSIWKQILLSITASIPFFTHGIQSTALTSSTHSGHFNSTDDVLWTTTSMIIGAIISAPIFCYLIDRFGRKIGIYIISLLQGASCIPLLLPPNEINTIVLHVLAGVSSAGLFTILPIYLREINKDSNRALAMSLMMTMTTAGYLMKLATDSENLVYVMVALVMLQFLLVALLLESPSYLVKVGKIENAEKNIAKLKCLTEDHPNVAIEINGLKAESERARGFGSLTLISILRNEIWRDATKIGIALYTTIVLCGSLVFLDQGKALKQLDMTVDPDSVLVLVCMFAGSMFCATLIKFLERRYLLTFGFVVMVFSSGVLAVYTQSDLTVTELRWVPVVALAVLVFAYGISWALPIVIMVEIYNLEIRSIMLGVLYTYSQIIKLIHVLTFPYIENYMGIYTIFYIFAFINLYGVVYSLFAVPDIKGRTVKQIEKQLKRIPILK